MTRSSRSAKVYESLKNHKLTYDFSDKATHLYEVSRAPEETWPQLCAAIESGVLSPVVSHSLPYNRVYHLPLSSVLNVSCATKAGKTSVLHTISYVMSNAGGVSGAWQSTLPTIVELQRNRDSITISKHKGTLPTIVELQPYPSVDTAILSTNRHKHPTTARTVRSEAQTQKRSTR